MNDLFKRIGNKRWFIPVILLLFLLMAAPTLFKKGTQQTIDEATTEEQLEILCNALSGVQNAKVMISYETVVAAGSFGYGSERTEKICGIAVVCDGGDLPEVRLRIYEMLSALYKIPSTRISVCGRGI